MRSRPAADVAWAFITEEARLPDILDQLDNLWAEHGGDAERARYGRQRLDRATPEQRARWDAKAKRKARAAERQREDEWALARRIVIAVDEEDEPTAAQAIESVRGEADEWTGGRGTPVSLAFRIGGHVVEDPTPRFPSEDQITVLRVIPGVLDVFLDRVDEDATTATPDLDPEPEPAAEEVDYPADLRAWAESGPYEMVTRLLHSYAAGLGRNAKYGPAVRQKAISLLRQAKAAAERDPGDTATLVRICTADPLIESDAGDIDPDDYD